MEIIGVTHPVKVEHAERIYNENKTVYVGKSYLAKVSEGDKFVIYESHGASAYTGHADIKAIGKIGIDELLNRYSDQLIVTEKELKEYAGPKKELNFIEFENFKKFKNPVKPKRNITMRGKYIHKGEFENITAKK